MITFSEAAKLAGVTKGAVRKAALEKQKLTASKDEQGVWRVDAADIGRVWPRRPSVTEVIDDQHTPVIVGDDHQSGLVITELRGKLEAAEQRLADRDRVIDDLRQRLDTEAEERRRLTAVLTDERLAAKPIQQEHRGFWSRLFGRT